VKLAVVIPALDEADWIAGAVESARAEAAEVVVVDGGSRDGTAAIAAAAGARVLASPPGRARQLQVGANATESDALVFLHADTRLGPGWARAVRDALGDPRVVAGAFPLRFDRRTPSLRLVEWGARLRAKLLSLPYGDQAPFVRREALAAVGGVPQVPLMEDLELVMALRRRGRIAIVGPPVTTSARRYAARGVWRTAGLHAALAVARLLGVDGATLARRVER
jgi:rSAM/selenodomain-associated transferase 2